jgi:polysaccharide biosynthesis protein PslH
MQKSVKAEQPQQTGTQALDETSSKARGLVIFDEFYSANDNLIVGYVAAFARQLPFCTRLDVVCRGPYRGPRLDIGSQRVQVHSTNSLNSNFKRDSVRVMSRWLSSFRLAESRNRWISNIGLDDEQLMGVLSDAKEMHAVVVFTQSLAFAVKVARLAHIFSGTSCPHLIVVTPQTSADSRLVADLQWLKVCVLQDGEQIASLLPDGVNPTAAPPFRRYRGVKRTFAAASSLWRGVLRRATRQRFGHQPAYTPPVAAFNPEIHLEDAAPAPTRAVLAFSSSTPLSFYDGKAFPYRHNISQNSVTWEHWCGPGLRRPARVRDVVLFVRPDWMSCGSGTYFESLAQYFRAQDALLIDIAIWPFAVNFTPTDSAAKLDEQNRIIGGALHFALRASGSFSNFVAHLPKILSEVPRTVVNQTSLRYLWVPRPHTLKLALQKAQINKVYVNHYFTYAFAKDLVGDRSFFLDTHDIQSINFFHHMTRNALTKRLDHFDAMLKEEVAVLRKADRLSFVSLSEIAIAETHLDKSRLFNFIALPQVVPLTPKPLGRVPRVLLVASRNPGNERNIDWFLDEVWPTVIDAMNGTAPAGLGPIQQSATAVGVHLDICGNIKSYLGEKKIPFGKLHGVVDSLLPYYEAADLVVLPIITGGGAAMKTIEALLHERPVVATKHAFRGLPQDIEAAIGFSAGPQALAQDIIKALTDPHVLERLYQTTRVGAGILRDQRYFDKLTEALEAVRTPTVD